VVGGYPMFRDNIFVPSKQKSVLPGLLIRCLSVQISITNQQTTLPDIPEGPRPYFEKL